MNIDPDRHEVSFAAPDNSTSIVREAIPAPAPPGVVVPTRNELQGIAFGEDGKSARDHVRNSGLWLIRRGLHLLGVALAVAGAWYVSVWYTYGQMPFSSPRITTSFDHLQPRVVPPEWLLAILGTLALASFGMMFAGVQKIRPRT